MNILEQSISILTDGSSQVKMLKLGNEDQIVEELRTYFQKNTSSKDKMYFEKCIQSLKQMSCNTKLQFSILYEIYIYFLRIENKPDALKAILNQKLVVLVRSQYLEEEHLCNLVNLLDKNISTVFALPSNDKLSLYVYFIEKIFKGHSKNLCEMVRICCKLAVEDKKEYLEGLAVLIASDFKENKQQKIKQKNGERLDCLSMLIIGIMNRIEDIQSDTQIQDENQILDTYNSAIKVFDDFLKNLFHKSIEESGGQTSISAAQSAKNKKESQKIQLFLFGFANDLCKQIYSPEYSIAPIIFNRFIAILNNYINQPTYYNNHFIIDITKSILKLLYKDTSEIITFANDMQFIPCSKTMKGKKSKNVGSVFCNMCSEIGFFSLQQNEDQISFCEECANFSHTSQSIPSIKNLQDLLSKETLALFQTLTYQFSDYHHKTQNSNFLDSRSTFIVIHFIQQAYNRPNASTKGKKMTFFLNNLTSQTKFGVPDTLGSRELDFLDFIYKSKVQNMFLINDKLEFLLKYIFGLTNDNSSLIRNKSLVILSEIESFNKSTRFEQHIDIRKRDQQVTVRLTCLKILEQLFTKEDQSSFESDAEYKNRKDRYFKMIMDRFNDKEIQVRGIVLTFISNNIGYFAEDNSLKISLIKELISRVINDTQEFQKQSLDILAKIYFPFFQGKVETKKATKRAKKDTKKNQNKDKKILNIEEEKTLENILNLQKMHEINTEIMVRVFSHFQENQIDSQQILNTLLQVSLKILEDTIKDSQERRYILGVIEVLSKLKNGYEIYKEFQIFIQYFDCLFLERNQIPVAQKEQRGEVNYCMTLILDIIINMFQRNSFVSTPQIKSQLSKIEDKILNYIQREGNVQVLKKLVQVSAYSVNFSSQDVQKISEIFHQRYDYLKKLQDEQQIGQKINNIDPNEIEVLVFRITMSIYIVSIYAYNFMDGAFKALTITLKDIFAVLLYYLKIQNERIQQASFDNISLLWEKDYDSIFSCQDILQEIINDKSSSPKLLITIYTIFDKYIQKHTKQIKDKINKQTTIKNSMIEEGQEYKHQDSNDDQEFEHITSVIRELTVKSYEQCLQHPDLMLKQIVLRLLNLLVNEKLVLFWQIGTTIIPLVCDPDQLTRTLANSIIQQECLKDKDSIDRCLKVGLKKSAAFIDQNYKQFTITEDNDDKCISLFERINIVLKIRDTPEKDTNILAKRISSVLEEINDWSFEDHEISFFIIQLIVSLNQITHGDILILLNTLRQVSERLYFDVKDFLKKSINKEIDYSDDDEEDHASERSFIKANILLMCLTASHILIIQSNIFPSKYNQIDNFLQNLNLSQLQGFDNDDCQVTTRISDIQPQKVRQVKKFNGDRNILENISDLFLEQMRDFDCQDQTQLKMLRSKIKHLFYDYVESDIFKVLDMSYTLTDKRLQSGHKSKKVTNKIQVKTKQYNKSTSNVTKLNKQKNQRNVSNVHKASNYNESSYHSCKGSKKSGNQDLDFSGILNKTSTSLVTIPLRMNLRNRQDTKRFSLIQESDDCSDTYSENNSSMNDSDQEYDQ